MSALDTQVGGDHYKKLKIQPVEYMHANGIPFIEGCIIKYASRWRDKGGIADLEKIKHFAQLLIDLELKSQEPEVAEQPSHIISDIPSWNDAPEWAGWLAQDVYGYCWYKLMPTAMNERNWNRGMDDRREQDFRFCNGCNQIPDESITPSLHPRPARTAQ